MGQQQRRPGFLRWGEGARATGADAGDDAPLTGAELPRGDEPDATTPAAERDEPTTPESGQPIAAAAASGPPEGPEVESPFLRDLVGAMRGVAESSRDATIAELRASVDGRLEELKAASGERAEELRRRSELDLGGIGDWERSELERVRAEAEERRRARRELLEKELADHQAATDRDLEALRARLGDYEREMDAFFAQLTGIDDPAAFVAAAKRMPPPPELAARPATGAAPDPSPTTSEAALDRNGTTQPAAGIGSLADRLAQLDERLGVSPAATDADATPAAVPSAQGTAASATATAETAGAPTATATAPAAAETSTPIIVKGLGSFGAITSFKQALERVDGIRGVTLSLGPTGDFVYRASHAADFDLVAAIRSIEGPNAGIEETDGQLRVTIERPR